MIAKHQSIKPGMREFTVMMQKGNHLTRLYAWLYGIYAAFVLLECIDLLAFLKDQKAGLEPTYDIVHVGFFILELIVNTALAILFMMLGNLKKLSPLTMALTVLIITTFRTIMIYYLYCFTDPQVHFVPYIYKNVNAFSEVMRVVILPAQIISGFVCSVFWIRIIRKTKLLKNVEDKHLIH
ncbi:hypothetical protein [Pedobacter frigidisoli]|uniref:hypothetical protein n=1 Tax=Pedobacter frigidisoli TaxID=2530455 RepID=UPI00292D37CF|nr:hypothetical protein [Pedobacter frigidisoli]